jgi:hypothetical protein
MNGTYQVKKKKILLNSDISKHFQYIWRISRLKSRISLRDNGDIYVAESGNHHNSNWLSSLCLTGVFELDLKIYRNVEHDNTNTTKFYHFPSCFFRNLQLENAKKK